MRDAWSLGFQPFQHLPRRTKEGGSVEYRRQFDVRFRNRWFFFILSHIACAWLTHFKLTIFFSSPPCSYLRVFFIFVMKQSKTRTFQPCSINSHIAWKKNGWLWSMPPGLEYFVLVLYVNFHTPHLILSVTYYQRVGCR